MGCDEDCGKMAKIFGQFVSKGETGIPVTGHCFPSRQFMQSGFWPHRERNIHANRRGKRSDRPADALAIFIER
jgi:hypothetical protein